MSYSISAKARTKDEAMDEIKAKLDDIVKSQPIHAIDIEQAKSAAAALVDIVSDNDGRDIVINVNGSVSTDKDGKVTNVNVGIQCYPWYGQL